MPSSAPEARLRLLSVHLYHLSHHLVPLWFNVVCSPLRADLPGAALPPHLHVPTLVSPASAPAAETGCSPVQPSSITAQGSPPSLKCPQTPVDISAASLASTRAHAAGSLRVWLGGLVWHLTCSHRALRRPGSSPHRGPRGAPLQRLDGCYYSAWMYLHVEPSSCPYMRVQRLCRWLHCRDAAPHQPATRNALQSAARPAQCHTAPLARICRSRQYLWVLAMSYQTPAAAVTVTHTLTKGSPGSSLQVVGPPTVGRYLKS